MKPLKLSNVAWKQAENDSTCVYALNEQHTNLFWFKIYGGVDDNGFATTPEELADTAKIISHSKQLYEFLLEVMVWAFRVDHATDMSPLLYNIGLNLLQDILESDSIDEIREYLVGAINIPVDFKLPLYDNYGNEHELLLKRNAQVVTDADGEMFIWDRQCNDVWINKSAGLVLRNAPLELQ